MAKTKILFGALIFFGIHIMNGQSTTDSLSLQNVLEIILENNPLLKQSEGKIDIAQSNIGVAESYKYPKMILEGSFTYVDPVSEVTLPIGDNPIVLPLFPNDNYNLYAGVQYVLYDFGRTKEVINISKIEKLISEEGLEAAQKQLTYAATELFTTILFTENAINVQNELITSLQRNLKRINGFVDNGLATSFDQVNTNVRITTAQNKKVGLQNSLNNLKYHLGELMGRSSDAKELAIKGILNIEKQRNEKTFIPKEIRSELAIAKHVDSILISGQKLANKGNLPFITIGGTTGFHNGYLPDLDEFRFNYAAFAKVTVPIFQGFKVKHEKEIAKIKIENSTWHLKEIDTKINTEITSALETLENAYKQYENNKILIQQAKIAVQQARKKYENQLITNLDLLDTEVVLSGAQLSLLESEYKCIMAQYKLQQAKGIKIWQSTFK
ncbi:Outer membrane protein TolC [Maribacter dokdonensis]|uniref:Outer membrane protein TolC n=2 Tax=Maribacter dokdonensis TaxID=320912 RepID=A0ABY0UMS8_9FLAO|nr:Outer membrane protein TolC [Maribacter dokdonensis]